MARDGDHTFRTIFDRHYSRIRYSDGRSSALFMGPGYKMLLITPDATAILGWRKFVDSCIDERTGEKQAGVNCCVFRNEGAHKSSHLILAAEILAWEKWPGERLYTYVDAKKIRSNNPGCCFKKAGWRKCGVTKGGLLILEKLPESIQKDRKSTRLNSSHQ